MSTSQISSGALTTGPVAEPDSERLAFLAHRQLVDGQMTAQERAELTASLGTASGRAGWAQACAPIRAARADTDRAARRGWGSSLAAHEARTVLVGLGAGGAELTGVLDQLAYVGAASPILPAAAQAQALWQMRGQRDLGVELSFAAMTASLAA
jgi:hypothetical protein